LKGHGGDDILIGGTLSANEAALLAIGAEWNHT